jgi:hypothetical protein
VRQCSLAEYIIFNLGTSLSMRYEVSVVTIRVYHLIYWKLTGIAQLVWLGYRPEDLGIGVRLPAGTRGVSLLHKFQTGSWAHPASYPKGTGSCFRGGKAGGVWIWPLTSIQCLGKNGKAIPSLPQTPSWHGACVLKPWDNFTVTLQCSPLLSLCSLGDRNWFYTAKAILSAIVSFLRKCLIHKLVTIRRLHGKYSW